MGHLNLIYKFLWDAWSLSSVVLARIALAVYNRSAAICHIILD